MFKIILAFVLRRNRHFTGRDGSPVERNEGVFQRCFEHGPAAAVVIVATGARPPVPKPPWLPPPQPSTL